MNTENRWFLLFRPETTLYNKVMVFTNISRTDAWEKAVRAYQNAILDIFSEQDFARLFPVSYGDCNKWVEFGTECKFSRTAPNGSITDVVSYPRRFTETTIAEETQKTIKDVFAMATGSKQGTTYSCTFESTSIVELMSFISSLVAEKAKSFKVSYSLSDTSLSLTVTNK